VDWNGSMLTDQQRVDRYNDLRAFQMMTENGYEPNQMKELGDFLKNQQIRRTKQEILTFLEQRMKLLFTDQMM
jgi:hypothetical protein